MRRSSFSNGRIRIRNMQENYMAKAKISTPSGDIVVRLYDETPAHRDNFIKLASEGFYDGTLFHRVISGFMIQGGDPDSRNAPAGKQLGAGDVGYTIPAEIKPGLIHKRGALCAARTADSVNPEKRSSGCQFYIVWGEKYSAGKMDSLERQCQMQAVNGVFNRLVSEHRDEILALRRERNREALSDLQDRLVAEANAIVIEEGLGRLGDAQKEAYTTVGGTPFLDGEYTVFGEVESGLDVVEKIQAAATDSSDRPLEDISMKVSVL